MNQEQLLQWEPKAKKAMAILADAILKAIKAEKVELAKAWIENLEEVRFFWHIRERVQNEKDRKQAVKLVNDIERASLADRFQQRITEGQQ